MLGLIEIRERGSIINVTFFLVVFIENSWGEGVSFGRILRRWNLFLGL